ncbi:rhodanese-like domain-containing protein [Alkalitalea saponilacus]|nr:rhodanese-like domain-containing protein [Alkalitalea saponilacus]
MIKSYMLLLAFLILSAGLQSQDIRVTEINSYEFFKDHKKLLTHEKVKILDGRTDSMFQVQHIHGAINIDVDLCNAAKRLQEEATTPVVVVYCTSNRRSRDMIKILSTFYQGEVYLISDGIRGWSNNDLPLLQRPSPKCIQEE